MTEPSLEEIMRMIENDVKFAEMMGLTVPQMAKMAEEQIGNWSPELRAAAAELLGKDLGITRDELIEAARLTSMIVEQGKNNVQFHEMLGITPRTLSIVRVALLTQELPKDLLALFDNEQDLWICGMLAGMGVGAVWARRHDGQ